MQIIDDKALLVRTNDPQPILDTIKKSHLLEQYNGESKIAVHWGLKEAQALASLGILDDIPSPIQRDYKWPGKFTPFDHQKVTSAFLTLRKRAFCFSEQGTAKTASVIWAIDYLMQRGLIKRALVVCPLSIMKSVWQQEIFRCAMHRSCSIAYGDAKQRKKILNAGSQFVVINHDGVGVVKEEVLAGGFDIIVVDEANAYKNAQTNRWKVLRDVAKQTDWLWMLTGTPAAQSPLDAYGLAKLVNPENTPKFFGHFRDQTMYKLTQFKWVPKANAEQIVHKLLQPAIRFEKADCLDLPEVMYIEREAPLTAVQKLYYKTLKEQMLFEADGEEVSAVNAAVKINKLLQISGGAVYTDNGEVIEFDVNNRLNVVLEAIEEASHKVLVFVPYTHTINLLRDCLVSNKIPCEIISGKVTPNKRNDIVTRFQNQKDPHVLILQPQTAAHGLTLTAANTIIWYSPITSVETYLQANARIDRPGQKNAMTVINIRGSEVESRLFNMLQSNIDNHEKLVDLYKREIGIK